MSETTGPISSSHYVSLCSAIQLCWRASQLASITATHRHWRPKLFTDVSSFTESTNDRHASGWRPQGERYADCKGSSIIVNIFTSVHSVRWGGGGHGPSYAFLKCRFCDIFFCLVVGEPLFVRKIKNKHNTIHVFYVLSWLQIMY